MDTEYVESVLDAVELVPAGQVTTYGDVALLVAGVLGRGGARQVGTALREAGAAVPWWRVVRASGEPPAHKSVEALVLLRAEGCPVHGNGRVVLARGRADLQALAAAAQEVRRKEMDDTVVNGE